VAAHAPALTAAAHLRSESALSRRKSPPDTPVEDAVHRWTELLAADA